MKAIFKYLNRNLNKRLAVFECTYLRKVSDFLGLVTDQGKRTFCAAQGFPLNLLYIFLFLDISWSDYAQVSSLYCVSVFLCW